MTLGAASAIAYGLLVIVGGAIGYAQARSRVSLISGLVSGGLLLLAGGLWSQGSPLGMGLAIGATVALVIIFSRRWWQTGKAMPAAPMIIAGLGALLAMGLSLR